MRRILLIAVPGGAIFTLLAWSLTRLSSDAIGMALGLAFGVLSGVPTAALVLLARRHDEEDEEDDYAGDDYIDVPVTYSDEVTPYYRLAARLAGLPQLPDRQTEIDQLRAALNYIEAQEGNR